MSQDDTSEVLRELRRLSAEQRELSDHFRRDNVIEEMRTLADSIRNLYSAFVEHRAKTDASHTELRGEIRGVSLRVGALEKDAFDASKNVNELKVDVSGLKKDVDGLKGDTSKLDEWVEETGRHEIVTLRENKTWWQRLIVKSAVTVGLGGIGAVFGWLLTKLLRAAFEVTK